MMVPRMRDPHARICTTFLSYEIKHTIDTYQAGHLVIKNVITTLKVIMAKGIVETILCPDCPSVHVGKGIAGADQDLKFSSSTFDDMAIAIIEIPKNWYFL